MVEGGERALACCWSAFGTPWRAPAQQQLVPPYCSHPPCPVPSASTPPLPRHSCRHWATTTAYRMDLAAARSGNPAAVAAERARFQAALAPLLAQPGPKLLVTDSQVQQQGLAGGVGHWGLLAEGACMLPWSCVDRSCTARRAGHSERAHPSPTQVA